MLMGDNENGRGSLTKADKAVVGDNEKSKG
jgi:hypothetical protein